MHVKTLTLHNYRCFQDAELAFHRQLTVLAGINGSGKTTVLDALVHLFTELPRRIRTRLQTLAEPLSPDEAQLASRRTPTLVKWLSPQDIRTGTNLAYAWLHVVDPSSGESTWGAARTRIDRPEPLPPIVTKMDHLVEDAARSIARNDARLPLTIYLPAKRYWRDVYGERRRGNSSVDPLSAFQRGVGHGWNEFEDFFDWFRSIEDLENETRIETDDAYRHPHLEAVRRAVRALFPGFTDLRVHRASGRFVIERDGKRLSLAKLSDGEKSLLTIAGDIARRLAIANPNLLDPLVAEAVVLIDEIETHLHPGWQRMMAESLTRTFPECQFILTTHSPIVLSSVSRESILLLESFQPRSPGHPTRGRDANAILAEVMGVERRSDEARKRIESVYTLLESSDLASARKAIGALEDDLGWTDDEVIRMKTRLDFLDAPLADDE